MLAELSPRVSRHCFLTYRDIAERRIAIITKQRLKHVQKMKWMDIKGEADILVVTLTTRKTVILTDCRWSYNKPA
uniref:Uncharacterized protein n=1 Tax=Tetraselmis sp. GSL018 TaxID=582737 RepID=A0A061RIH1_9CHLO